MRHYKYLELIACFMIALVITIPFSISAVFAAPSISLATASGSDGFPGVMKANDVIDVKASIEDGSGVTKDRVLLGTEPFDSCETQFTTICSKQYSPPGGFGSRILPFNVRLLDESLNPVQDFGGTIAVDGQPAQVSLNSVNPSHSSGQEDISFTYTATDTACTGDGCGGKCSGISSIEFFTADNKFRQVVEENSPSCTLSGTFVVEASKFSNGNNRLLARATDRFQQAGGENFIDFTVDLTGPSIDSGSFTLLRDGDVITHFIPFTDYGVTVEVFVSEQDVDLNNVFADLSQLNPGASLSNVPGTCQAQAGGASCEWNIVLNLNQGGAKEIEIRAGDTSGNIATAVMSKNFVVDNAPPQITDIFVPGVPENFKYLARPTTDIKALISDVGSGFSKNTIFLQTNGQKVAATSCDSSSCLWKDLSLGVSSGSATVSIHPDSSDLVGNKAGAFSQTFTLNTNLPGFEVIEVQGIGSLSGVVENFISIGDRIAVIANLTHDQGLAAAFADFSDFIEGATQTPGSCTLTDDANKKFTCVWLSGPVEKAFNGEVTVFAADGARNFISESVPLKTFLALDEAQPDYFTSAVTCSPEALDREIGTLAEQRSYCTITLIPQDTANPISVELAGCTGDQSSLLSRAELFHNQVGSLSPLLKLTLRKNEFKLDDLKTACTLLIHSQVGSAITKVPEEEVVNVQLFFYNNPLGELSDSVQTKVDEAIKNTQGIWDLIGTMRSLVVFLEKVCRFITFLYGLQQLFATMVVTLKISAATCDATVVGWLVGGCQGLHAAATNGCTTEQVNKAGIEAPKQAGKSLLQKGVDACKYVNCQKSWPHLFGTEGDIKKLVTDWMNELPGIDVLGESSRSLRAENLLKQDNSLIWSIVPPPCIPGIINKLDDFRQIQCLYADCMQTGVLKDNIPIKICEDLKSEATCKYIMGELFAIVPYTAALDKITGLAKKILSDPLLLLGIIGKIGAACTATCAIPDSGASFWACEGIDIASKLGEFLKNVQGLLSGKMFSSPQDYCDRLDVGEQSSGGGFLGIL